MIVSNGEPIQPKHLRFRSFPANVPTPAVTENDEYSPLNATDSVPHLDGDETEKCDDTILPLGDALERYEQQYLGQVSEQAGGNRAEATRLLKIPERTFYRKLAKYNL